MKRRRVMGAALADRLVKRVLGDQSAVRRTGWMPMPLPVETVIDPDGLAVVFVFPNQPLAMQPIHEAFWAICQDRGWAEEGDGQRAVVVLVPSAGGREADTVTVYVELRRSDTEYPGEGGPGYVGTMGGGR